MNTLPLRVLVVAPRPAGLSLPSHDSLEALYDALEAQGEQVVAEYLWPATRDALAARLGAQDSPAVGIVYLDVVAAEGGAGLCFEGQAVTAEELGAILCGRGIGLLLLAIWDEGQEGRSQNLAAALAEASGKPVVLLDPGFAEGSAKALAAFLSGLLAGHAPGQTLAEGLSFYPAGEDVPLVAPAPGPAQGVGKIVRFPGPELTPAWSRLAQEPEAGGLPPEPAYGFVGRARELSALERALRDEGGNGLVLVHGYEGLGKTTLVAHVARWLVRSGRFAQVVYTRFTGGGYADSALYDLGERLIGGEFSPAKEDAVEAVERALAETPTLVIWDGLEVVLPEGETPLGAAALDELLQLGARLACAGRSRVCVISENPAFPSPAYAPEKLSLSLALEGLDEADAAALLERALRGAGGSALSRQEAQELAKAFGGHPLALNVLAPLGAERPLPELTAQLKGILPGLDAGEARLRNQGLAAALEALLRSPGEDLSQSAFAFGLFVDGFMEPLALRITQLAEEPWAITKKRLSAAQLLRDVRLPGLNVPFVALCPALTRHLSRRLSALQHKELEQRFYTDYFALMSWAMQGGSHLPAALQPLVRCELPNLRRGVRILLAVQELEVLSDYSHFLQYALEQLGLKKEQEALGNEVQAAILKAVSTEGPLSRAGVRFLLGRSERLFAAGRVPEVGKLLDDLLKRMEQENGLAYGGDEATFDQGVALHRLGRCWQAVGNGAQAASAYARALELLGALMTNPDARRELMLLQADLGGLLLVAGQMDKAEEAYQRGLALAEELGDRYRRGTMSAQLGTIAFAREQPEQAKRLCEAALEHLQGSEDYAGTATVWGQLAAIALRGSDLAEAKRCYEQALELTRKAGNALFEAQILVQLAQVAEQTRQPREAEADYVQALRIYQERNVRQAVVATEMALARLLLGEGQPQNARIHAEAARVVAEGSPDVHPWQVYVLLRRIAEEEKDVEKVAHWRARAQEAFASSPESKAVLRQWRPMIVGAARACRGEALDSGTVELLEKLEGTGQWQKLAATIWRILGGERGEELVAELDHVDALIVRRILAVAESPELEHEDERSAPSPVEEPAGGPPQARED